MKRSQFDNNHQSNQNGKDPCDHIFNIHLSLPISLSLSLNVLVFGFVKNVLAKLRRTFFGGETEK